MPPEATEQIIPAIIVVVAYANPGLPASACQPGFLRDVGKGAISVVLVKTRSRLLASRPLLVQPCSIRQVNVQPAVVVVVEKCDATALGFDDVALAIRASPYVGSGKSGLARNIDELAGRLGGISPTPGGRGVVEAGMSLGLTAAGVSEADATAAVFIQRLFTSYLPPIWGWATLVWMRKREYL